VALSSGSILGRWAGSLSVGDLTFKTLRKQQREDANKFVLLAITTLGTVVAPILVLEVERRRSAAIWRQYATLGAPPSD
jgi:hypothetical protein